MEKIKKVTFTSTGENRFPKEGEYYMSENNWYLATFDFTQESYDIYTLEVIEEQWKPEAGEKYFFISDIMEVNETTFVNVSRLDNVKYSLGNCFRTRESAEAKLKEIKEILLN